MRIRLHPFDKSIVHNSLITNTTLNREVEIDPEFTQFSVNEGLTFELSPCLKAALKQATEELQETQRVLAEAKARLAEVEEGIASLQAKYEECIAKKQELEFKTEQCTARLGRAEKVSVPQWVSGQSICSGALNIQQCNI